MLLPSSELLCIFQINFWSTIQTLANDLLSHRFFIFGLVLEASPNCQLELYISYSYRTKLLQSPNKRRMVLVGHLLSDRNRCLRYLISRRKRWLRYLLSSRGRNTIHIPSLTLTFVDNFHSSFVRWESSHRTFVLRLGSLSMYARNYGLIRVLLKLWRKH